MPTIRRILPALLLALVVTGCGDEDPVDAEPVVAVDEDVADQATALLECTTGQGLPGSIGMAETGILTVDLTTETETIVVHLLSSEAAAASYQNSADLEQEQVENAVILGGAITPEHRSIITTCLQDS